MNRLFLFLIYFISLKANAQNTLESNINSSNDQILKSNKNLNARKWLIGSISVAGYGVVLYGLNEAWYKGYGKTSFHTFNDSKEWLQMDKAGHAWTAYNASRATTAFWKWAGLPPKKAVLLGGLSSLGYMTVIELLDGYSPKWGWSWGDIAANTMGAGLFALQDLGWQDQRIQFKFSAHRINYTEDLKIRANELFGESMPQRLLKDYNAQTLWLSFNLKSFLPKSELPAWLNLSLGYGAAGMFGGFENKAFDKEGNITFYRPEIKRFRQWYLSPDIDFTKIKSNKKGIRFLLATLNILKVPAPAIEFSNGKVKGRIISF